VSAVRKAVIPAAGFGTRLYPATKAVKKELFPVVDRDGIVKPFIQLIVEEVLSSGIDEVCIVLQQQDVPVFRDYFQGELPEDLREKLAVRKTASEQTGKLRQLGKHVSFAVQGTQEGFGHAVMCAREWVAREPFLLLLGDHAYISNTDITCARQLLDVFEESGVCCVGVDRTPADSVHLYGTIKGAPVTEKARQYKIEEYVEKPSADYARENLTIDGLERDTFMCLFGQYVLTPGIFGCLEQLIEKDIREQGEVQFTDALQMLCEIENGHMALEIDGNRYDIGVPEQYIATLAAFAKDSGALTPYNKGKSGSLAPLNKGRSRGDSSTFQSVSGRDIPETMEPEN